MGNTRKWKRKVNKIATLAGLSQAGSHTHIHTYKTIKDSYYYESVIIIIVIQTYFMTLIANTYNSKG